jgi:PAS domain S-box-containing protein
VAHVSEGNRDGERRRRDQAGQSPLTVLAELPALVVLERLPVPALAIGPDGAILFANGAFATMLGHTPETLQQLKFQQIFHPPPADEAVISVTHAQVDRVVTLLHTEGFMVRAKMSKSALLRGDDPVAVVTFQDLTEQLWVAEP